MKLELHAIREDHMFLALKMEIPDIEISVLKRIFTGDTILGLAAVVEVPVCKDTVLGQKPDRFLLGVSLRSDQPRCIPESLGFVEQVFPPLFPSFQQLPQAFHIENKSDTECSSKNDNDVTTPDQGSINV